MRSKWNLLFCILFVTLTLGVGLFGLLKPKETISYYENRNLAVFPSFNISAVADGSWFRDLETYFSDHSVGRQTLQKLDVQVSSALGRPQINGIVEQDGMLLPFLPYNAVDEEAIKNDAELQTDSIRRLCDQIEAYGGSYFYVALPTQVEYNADRYPWYLNNRQELVACISEQFFKNCSEKGIPVIDMADRFAELGYPENLSSHVDHHCSLLGGYEIYRSIVSAINAQRETPLPFPQGDEITFHELPNPYLGSRNRPLFGYLAQTEHLWVSAFKTPVFYRRFNNGYEIGASVFDYDPNDTAGFISYTMYMGGDIANTVIDTGRDELPSILIYGESYTNCVEALLYYSFNEMHSIDKHAYHGSISDYIAEVKPDYVVCLRDYSVLCDNEGNGELFE